MASNTVVPIPVSAASGVLNAFTASLAIYEALIRTFFFRSTINTDKVAIYGSNDGTTISTGVLVNMGANSAPVSIDDRCRFYVAIFTGSGTRSCSVSVGPLNAGGGGGSGTHFNTIALGNFAAGGVIGTAPNTVDQFQAATIAQTTAGQTLTLPAPTDPSATTVFLVEGAPTATNSFIMYGQLVLPSSSIWYIYNGSGWGPAAPGASDGGSTVIGDPSAAAASNVQMFAGSGGLAATVVNGGNMSLSAAAAGGLTGTFGLGGVAYTTTGATSFITVGFGIQSTAGIDITAIGAFNITLTPGATGAVRFPPRAAGAGNTTQTRWLELAANGVNYVAFQAPDALAGDTPYTLPPAYPTAVDQELTASTAGVMTWKPKVNVQASNTNAQSIADGAGAAIITTWTSVTDSATAFVAATGIFTAPSDGFYQICAEIEFAAIASIVTGEFTVQIFVAGALKASGVEVCQVAAANCKRNPKVALACQLTAGQTVDIRATQNSGSGANLLTNVATRNVLSITKI